MFDRSTLAQKAHDGNNARSILEDELDRLWPDLVLYHSTDGYDNSLEVYMAESVGSDFAANPEATAAIFSWGFSCYWLNFADGSEQSVTSTAHGDRRVVAGHNHWQQLKELGYLD